MKKRTTMMAMIAMVFVLTACSTGQQQQPTVTTTPAPTQVTEVKPTEAPVATEAPTPTEEPTPTEAPTEVPTPTVSPNVMGDIDFTEYFNGNKKWYEAVNDSECEGARLVVKTFEDVYVLKDGDSFEMNEEEEDLIGYYYYVYSSKVTTSLDVPDELKDVVNITRVEADRNYGNMKYCFTIEKDVPIDHYDMKITVNYEDGTSETITFNLCKLYIRKS